MFPFRDHNLSSTVPYVTLALIAVNVVVFLLTLPALHGGPAQLQLYSDWALIPARATAGQDWGTVLTAMFLHGGWLHIFGNMLFLWIFGDNVEDAFGHAGFLLFYLACGVAATGVQIAADPSSTVPMVGASGAIAGVMGGYLLLYPKARVDVLIVIVIMIRLMVIPAWVVLGIWFGLQALAEFATNPAHGGVAYSAHVGGFLAGIALTLPLWLARGGTALWRSTGGRPDHPETGGGLRPSVVPVVRRR